MYVGRKPIESSTEIFSATSHLYAVLTTTPPPQAIFLLHFHLHLRRRAAPATCHSSEHCCIFRRADFEAEKKGTRLPLPKREEVA